MNPEILRIEKKEILPGVKIEIWTLDRPERLNAINGAMIKRLEAETKRIQAEVNRDILSCRGIVLTGAGQKAFVAGADIAEMDDFDRSHATLFSKAGHAAFGRLEELPIPTIAAINGFALGGGLELALCCDFLIATPTASLGQPELQLGLIPGFGATARFVNRLGLSRALELLWSGRKLSAEEALSLGLLDKLSPAGQNVVDFSVQFLGGLVKNAAPLAMGAVKRVAREAVTELYLKILESEAKTFGEMFDTKDKEEGVSAFLEKRPAQFKGK